MGSWGAEGGERKKGWGAEEQRNRGAEEEERTDNVWIQSSRNPTQNFVHPAEGDKKEMSNSQFPNNK
ncbi:MAG: hypothetical protein F6J92_16605 [Symploca sp. SIO1A3]|nr:hypothetical protein [Symploca sp. SIO1A3]